MEGVPYKATEISTIPGLCAAPMGLKISPTDFRRSFRPVPLLIMGLFLPKCPPLPPGNAVHVPGIFRHP